MFIQGYTLSNSDHLSTYQNITQTESNSEDEGMFDLIESVTLIFIYFLLFLKVLKCLSD